MASEKTLVGIDVGGTFTDAVVLDSQDGRVMMAFKLPSTPADPGAAVIQALERVSEHMGGVDATVCHGTTVGTNTLIERKGAKTALLATAGFVDVIELRRQNRPRLYDLSVTVSKPLIPQDNRFGVPERLAADGSVVQPVERIPELLEQLRATGVEAVAVSLLHAYANDVHEQEIRRAIEQALPGTFVTTSSDVCPEFREFERTSTTVVNAYIGPAVSRYMRRLDDEVRTRGVRNLMIVKSNGGLTSPENAASYPVHLIESGPAAGMIATAAYAKATERPNVIAFDMGGTTAKAGVVQNFEPKVTDEFHADRLVNGRDVGGYPIRSSVLDIVEIGAGGGSIAWIDAGGVVRVGPESAGADPGPACYSRGGRKPTVTDAHAVIGTLAPETFEGSGVEFDPGRAAEVLESEIAKPMGWSVARAAHAVVEIAIANMAEMVRLATVRRGLDPRDFAILASGGAGPLHAASVGLEVGSREVVIPPLPGMFSALGALLGKVRHDLSQTLLRPLGTIETHQLLETFQTLHDKAQALLAAEPEDIGKPVFQRYADLRFLGQMFELQVGLGALDEPLPSAEVIEQRFRTLYTEEFGFDLAGSEVELVNLRLVATAGMDEAAARVFDAKDAQSTHGKPYRVQRQLQANGARTDLPVYRTADCAGMALSGPVMIEHAGSTIWVRDRQRATIEGNGTIAISLLGGR